MGSKLELNRQVQELSNSLNTVVAHRAALQREILDLRREIALLREPWTRKLARAWRRWRGR